MLRAPFAGHSGFEAAGHDDERGHRAGGDPRRAPATPVRSSKSPNRAAPGKAQPKSQGADCHNGALPDTQAPLLAITEVSVAPLLTPPFGSCRPIGWQEPLQSLCVRVWWGNGRTRGEQAAGRQWGGALAGVYPPSLSQRRPTPFASLDNSVTRTENRQIRTCRQHAALHCGC